jgi:hypothetical protein
MLRAHRHALGRKLPSVAFDFDVVHDSDSDFDFDREGHGFSRAEKEPPKSTRLQPLRDAAPNNRPQPHPPAENRDGPGSLKLR